MINYIIGGLVLIPAGYIVYKKLRDIKKGENTCSSGGSCSSCAFNSQCGTEKLTEKI
jgi:hypothetical protein